MPRRRVVAKREILPDPKFNDRQVAKFINKIMWEGKKSIAESIIYNSFDIIEKKIKSDPLKLFRSALENVKPIIETKSRRVGGSTYQVPVEVRPGRRVNLAMKWLISFARARKENSMEERLAAELLDASNNRGSSVKKREDTHKMAEANKAFAHYRW
ncbi:MAG: 30S ribosomal protein S7 [Deltaproteobacteria bacterium]|nr:30S ribosomal protein S7 [Deltaproteobacteria bacterium]